MNVVKFALIFGTLASSSSFASSVCTLGEIHYDAKPSAGRFTDANCTDSADSIIYNTDEVFSAFSARSMTIKTLVDKGYQVKADDVFVKLDERKSYE